ncbi:MAG: phage terminase small subunit [Psychromonas sp.]|jgi:phage terminase small subunit
MVKQFKMTQEQKDLFDKLTPLQREISLNSIKGMSDVDAYKNSSGKAKADRTLRTSVSQILSNLNVVAFIGSMASEHYGRVDDAIMSRDEMARSLTNQARGSLSKLITFGDTIVSDEEGNPTTQSVWQFKSSNALSESDLSLITELTAGKEGFKIKIHDSKVAKAQLAKLMGYDKPTQSEVAHTGELTLEQRLKGGSKH